jgi:hypothetical protein
MRKQSIRNRADCLPSIPVIRLAKSVSDPTGWLWTGLIERISQDRRS